MSVNPGNIPRSVHSMVSAISGTFGYQSSNLWYFVFEPGTGPAAGGLDSLLLLGLVQSIQIPQAQIETESTNLEFNYISGYKSSGDVQVTFLETQLFHSFNFLNDWFNTIYDKDRKSFRARVPNKDMEDDSVQGKILKSDEYSGFFDPKRNGFLMYTLSPITTASPLADSLIGTIPNIVFRFEGMLLKSINQIDASYDNGDLLKITATFAVDKIEARPLIDGLPWNNQRDANF